MKASCQNRDCDKDAAHRTNTKFTQTYSQPAQTSLTLKGIVFHFL